LAAAAPLEVTGLVKKFSRGFRSFTAVSDVSFSMREGEILGFLGPNGAGKTTTIKCILGLLFPTSGSVSVMGAPPGSASVRGHLGYVPENPDYEDVFSPVEFLGLVAGMRNRRQSRTEMVDLLDRVGLTGWETARLRRFSKGMRQKFSLAVALQFTPDLIVMDEPTGGLDPTARKEFRDIILEENRRGATIFLSSHLLSEVETVCDRAIILSGGSVVREGSMEELLRTENRFRVSWVQAGPGEADRAGERIVEGGELQQTIDSLRSEGCTITSVREVFRSLEEVFLSATAGSNP
jgi:ABC-2 type transport system ATP-binding protein